MNKLKKGMVAALLMLSLSVSAGTPAAKPVGPGPTTPKDQTDAAVSGLMHTPAGWLFGAIYYTIKYGYYKS